MTDPTKPTLRQRLRDFLETVRTRVPPGLRFGLGLLLIIGGIFGFLPVLGFWMLPLGVAIAAMDVKMALRWWRKRMRKKDDPE